jgi:hypothetical protein
MQLCVHHFDLLKVECKKHDLLQFMATDGAKILMNASRLLENGGVPTAEAFDPVMQASFAIDKQFIEKTGSPIGPYACPLCDLDKSRPGTAKNWIEGVVADQLEVAQELGLLPKVGRLN